MPTASRAKTAKAKILSSKKLFQGRVFGLRSDRVREPGGVVATREIITHHGSVVVLPVFPDGSMLLVRQYRHAAAAFLWELVAGHIEPGRAGAGNGSHELAEETGYSARNLRKLVDFFPSPGLSTERMFVYLATGLTRGVARPEEDERIAVKRFSRVAVERMIRRGTIVDAKSIAGVLYYLRFGR